MCSNPISKKDKHFDQICTRWDFQPFNVSTALICGTMLKLILYNIVWKWLNLITAKTIFNESLLLKSKMESENIQMLEKETTKSQSQEVKSDEIVLAWIWLQSIILIFFQQNWSVELLYKNDLMWIFIK